MWCGATPRGGIYHSLYIIYNALSNVENIWRGSFTTNKRGQMETKELQKEVDRLQIELENAKNRIYDLRGIIRNLEMKKEYDRMQRMFRGGETILDMWARY